ncbi:hypothetical protein EVAR_83662_1 [Eumeta japonica]|uniref:Uncharacterized protein n=1 Tax=Eumeta variegata TaxID=151549 RepID=A0A4C1UNK9_EUMVA|nr:hypothetical protein EVAR_83662_1 [Eumeta japonica]
MSAGRHARRRGRRGRPRRREARFSGQLRRARPPAACAAAVSRKLETVTAHERNGAHAECDAGNHVAWRAGALQILLRIKNANSGYHISQIFKIIGKSEEIELKPGIVRVWAVWPAVAVAFTCAHPICTDRMLTGKRNRHRRPDSPDPNPKSKRDDISINQLT